jgi:predicted RNase H-like nuclease (RuvC/YqgF family)
VENEIITALVGTGSAAISSFITWLLSQRKQNADIDNTIIEGMQKSLEFYEKLSDDTKKRLEEAVEERNILSDKIEQQGREIAELKSEMLKLSISICYNMSCEIRKTTKIDKLNK